MKALKYYLSSSWLPLVLLVLSICMVTYASGFAYDFLNSKEVLAESIDNSYFWKDILKYLSWIFTINIGGVFLAAIYQIFKRLDGRIVNGLIAFIVIFLHFYVPRGVSGRMRLPEKRFQERVTRELQQINESIKLFEEKKGYLPERISDVKKTFSWKTRYWDKYRGNPFVYTLSSDKKVYELRSVGQDGKFGTEDDVVYEHNNK